MPKLDASCAGVLGGGCTKEGGGSSSSQQRKNKKDIGYHLTFHFG